MKTNTGKSIAIDLTALDDNLTGIERYAANITQALLQLDGDDRFILICKNKIPPIMDPFRNRENVRFEILEGGSKLLFNQVKLPKAIRKLGADVICFFAFPVPLLLKKRKNRKIIGTIHDICYWDTPECMERKMVYYYRWSSRHMAKASDRIVTISEFSRQRIMQQLHVPADRIILAYCGLSEPFSNGPVSLTEEQKEQVRSRYHLPEQFYLSLATVEPRKNLAVLLQAYAAILNRSSNISGSSAVSGLSGTVPRGSTTTTTPGATATTADVLSAAETPAPSTTTASALSAAVPTVKSENHVLPKLVLAGRKGWKMDALLEEIHLKHGDQVLVTGFIEDEDLPVLYQMADCFIFPSKYEGFGIPPLEALSQGVPVISSDAASLPEVLGDAARYFRSQDAQNLQKTIRDFQQEPQSETDKMREQGLTRSHQFSYINEANKILQYIKNAKRI